MKGSIRSLRVLVFGVLVVIGSCARPENQPAAPADKLLPGKPASAPVPPLDASPTPKPPEDPPPAPVPPEDLEALADGNNQFAVDLYRDIAERNNGNIAISPFSVRTALSMVYAGARGPTAEEMRKVLHFTLPDDRLHPAFGRVAYQLRYDAALAFERITAISPDRAVREQVLRSHGEPSQLTTANAVWGHQGVPFRDQFLQIVKKHYRADIRQVDFGQPEEARQTINRWAREKTGDRIKELLGGGDVTARTHLVLANAVHFKAAWGTPFDKKETHDAAFEVAPDETITVRMMQSPEGEFWYHATDDCEWLKLPYSRYPNQQHPASMIVLLPRKGRMAAVEQRLSPARFREGVGGFRMHIGKVRLPKFDVVTATRLEEVLARLGMPLAFSGSADFSGMTDGGGVAVSRVVHQTSVTVDEAGTEAAAATGVGFDIAFRPPLSFTADRPFLFFIRDEHSGTILFSGRVVRPLQSP